MSDRLIDRILEGDYANLKEDMINIIGKKVANRIQEEKQKVRNSFNGIMESEEEDQDDEDEDLSVKDDNEEDEDEDEDEKDDKKKKFNFSKKSKKDDEDDSEEDDDVDPEKGGKDLDDDAD